MKDTPPGGSVRLVPYLMAKIQQSSKSWCFDLPIREHPALFYGGLNTELA